ncbi:hypothetical protein FVE85_1142 [Porphyridium purpureum]|uniref:Uncharacterized protein n=1 Tax=Porphyridium purpureum TaxID=35688 RepID=A0A5J4Z3A1_PORPP|nr:hypothetical protein FVE85_1142 [Porphyridium purpureum]|eukprot:POR4721..scf208_2
MRGPETETERPIAERADEAPCVAETQKLLSETLAHDVVDAAFWERIGVAVFNLRRCAESEGILSVQIDAYQVEDESKPDPDAPAAAPDSFATESPNGIAGHTAYG